MADNTSFLTYMIGQNGKQGRGLPALDKAAGADKAQPTQPSAPTSAEPAPAPVAPPAASDPPLTVNGPELTQTQPSPFMLGDTDSFYRQMGRLPTAADLATQSFTVDFRTRMGRAPTKEETVAHLFRRPELIQQPASDFNTGE